MDLKTISLDRLAADTRGLPILSDSAERIFEYLNQSDATSAKLSEEIEKDPVLASKMLKVVNSPFFGFTRELYTINQAVVTLGFPAIKRLTAALSVFSPKQPPADYPLDMNRFAEDSFTSAVACQMIVNNFEPNLAETAFAIGFLMNIGQPLFALHYPNEYKSLIEQAQASDKSLNELERKTFLWDHARLGALLTRRWGFDDTVIMPVFYHHTPEPPIEMSGRESMLVPAAYIANLALEVFRSKAKKESLDRCISEAKRRLYMSEDTTHQILESISVKGNEIAKYFDLHLSLSLSYSQVLHAITVQLGEINLTYEQMVNELRKAKAEAEKLAHQLRMANEELKKRADTDGLTLLFNHRYFQEHVMVEYMRATRYGSPLSLVIFDVDHFKRVNDSYGHLTGDMVLREVAAMLKTNTRISDFVARYGGEEFAMVLPETSLENAFIVAEKIRRKIEDRVFMHEDKIPFKITISAGISSVESGKKYETADDFIKAADKKLYKAKRSGRNQVAK